MQGSKNFHHQQTFLTRKASDEVALLCCASGMLTQTASCLSLDYGEFQGSLTHSAYKTQQPKCFWHTSYLQLQHHLLSRIWKILTNSCTYQLQFYAVYHKYLQHYVDYFIFNKNYFSPLIIKCIFSRRDCNKLKHTDSCVNSGFHFLTGVRIVSLLI